MKKKIVICPGCNHFYARHIKNVEGDVICLDVHHFISDRGVVGLRSSIGCDCFNGKSVRADSMRDVRKAEEKRWWEVGM